MIASKVSRATLEAAAAEIGVSLDVSSFSETRHRVKVNPGEPPETVWQIAPNRKRLCPVCGSLVAVTGKATDGRLVGSCGDASPVRRWANGRRWPDERGDGKYQRLSSGYGRALEHRVFAVCWHGFRDFLRAVYRLEPNAVFYTAFDTWRGSEDFEARYQDSGFRNIGSQAMPISACEACRCPGAGHAN